VSDTVQRQEGSGSRIGVAILAAFLLHVVGIGVPLLLLPPKADSGLLVVDLAAAEVTPAPPPPSPAVAPPAASAAPAGRPAAAAVPSPTPGSASAGDFIIPTPRAPSQMQPAPSGQSFREEGGRVAASATTAVPQGPQPDFATPSRAAANGAASVDTGTKPPSGAKGVLVTGAQSAGGAAGSLDLGSLDKALVGARQGQGAGSGGTAGSGSGVGTSSVTSSGSGTGPGIRWDNPDQLGSRKLISAPLPKLPSWVSSQGITLTVVVSFMVSPEGVVWWPTLEKSCGYGDVDAAVLEAVRLWRFTADSTAPSVRGVVPYEIRTSH